MNRIQWAFLASICTLLICGHSLAQTKQTTRNAAQKAVDKLVKSQKFELKYKFKPGEEIRWKVEHTASTKAQIAGTNESTSSRTNSTKLWKVSDVDSLGNTTFVHSIEATSLWQKVGENPSIAFDSESSEQVPSEFLAASEMVGKPLAVVTISDSGKVLDRKTDSKDSSFGVGDICTPMPEKPVAIGHRWYVPTVFDATTETGRRLKLKARIHYQLSKVINGVAIISFRTEVLTPIENDQIRSQLLQKLNNGYVAFDIERGRQTTKEIEWNEKVQEYAGADSFLQYTAKMTEKIVVSTPKTVNRVSRKSAPKIKRPEAKPLIRK